MTPYMPAGTFTCRNCGNPIRDDRRSPTGLSHVTTGRTRCDGKTLSGLGTPAVQKATFPMAVAA